MPHPARDDEGVRPRAAGTAYDAIVVGIGAMGAAACWQLARRGRRVLGLERFDIPNRMGSSHGVTRIIRLAYHEHPSYVPLVRRAYELWREAERAGREQLLFVTGGIDAGLPGGRVVDGALASCEEHGLAHEVLSARELSQRFPGWRLPAEMVGVYQAEAGFLACERAVVTHAQLAMAAGADIRAREALIGWDLSAAGTVVVTTTRGRYEAERLILSTGPWIADHVPALRVRAVPERQVIGWFRPLAPEEFRYGRFPVGIVESDQSAYVLPEWGVPGVKIGVFRHLYESGHPDRLSREPGERDEELLRSALARFFPRANGPVMALQTCLFTNIPDERFVIDTLPDAPQVIVASPCSGHGFKFASVVGEILAELATQDRTSSDISAFSLPRLLESDRLVRTPAP
jgi:sarcosine oxidase